MGCALLLLLGCGSKSSRTGVVSLISAKITQKNGPVTADPAVYFANPTNPDPATPDFATVDVMFRDSALPTFDAFTLQVEFDPGVVQVGEVGQMTIFGDCQGSGPSCNPICENNAFGDTSISFGANNSGTLLVGVSKPFPPSPTPPCPSATATSAGVKLLTLGFIGATVGQSTLKLIPAPPSGGCAIIQGLASLGVPCDDGGAVLTANR